VSLTECGRDNVGLASEQGYKTSGDGDRLNFSTWYVFNQDCPWRGPMFETRRQPSERRRQEGYCCIRWYHSSGSSSCSPPVNHCSDGGDLFLTIGN